MSDPWLESGREELLAQQDEVAERQPYLSWDTSDPIVRLRGLFLVRHPGTGENLDGYDIEVCFPRAFPRRLPRVWEIGGRLPDEDRERHVSRKEGCCLFVDEEFHLRHPGGYTVAEFLAEPVQHYFLAQLYYELHDEWPWPVREHVKDGIEDAYMELLELEDRDAVLDCVNFLRRRDVKGRWNCPCGSDKKLQNCHGDRFTELQEKIPEETFKDTFHRLYGRRIPLEGRATVQ